MLRKIWILITLGWLLVGSSGCNWPQPISMHLPVPDAPRVWFDAPRDGSRIPLAPYEIVYHVNAPAGLERIELKVNGEMLKETTDTNNVDSMQTLRTIWTPLLPGAYTFNLKMQDINGEWSLPAEVKVYIGEEVTPTTETVTPTATATATPTNTPTVETNEAITFNTQASPRDAYYGNCNPHHVTLNVILQNAPINASVVIFTRIQDKASGNWTNWDSGTAMNPAGDNRFKRTLDITQLDNADLYVESRLLYQFVVVEKGDMIGRSPVYQDVNLYACGFTFPYLLETKSPDLPFVINTPIIVK